jgi:ubiquitin-protein ligase
MRKLQIFISSPILELHDERIVLRNEFNIRGINTFVFEFDAGARPNSAQQSYLSEVTDSDIYIGILWNQFSEATIKEFEHARTIGKACFVYVKNFDVHRDPKLDAFLLRIGDPTTGITYRYFNDVLELVHFARHDVQNWLVSEWRQKTERQASLPSPQLLRLQADFVHLLKLCQSNDFMKMVESEGAPPVRYVVEYNVKGIVGVDKLNSAVFSNRHLVQFELHEGYPMNLPFTRFLTPMFHPNVYGGPNEGFVCMGWAELPYKLSDVCIIVARMINYQIYQVSSPSNREAAEWAKRNSTLFPLDTMVLQGDDSEFIKIFSA